MDPRVKSSAEGLAKQFALSMQCYEGMRQVRETVAQIQKLRSRIKDVHARAEGELATALTELDKTVAHLEGALRSGGRGDRRGAPASREQSLSRVSQEMGQLLHLLQGADVTPTATAVTACEEVAKVHEELQARWTRLMDKEVKALNERLSKAGLPVLTPEGPRTRNHESDE